MEKKGNDLQEEPRSSQVYKVLTGSGIPVAGKIAQGLGKAAAGAGPALSGDHLDLSEGCQLLSLPVATIRRLAAAAGS